MLCELLDDPENLHSSLERYSTSLALSMTYGYRARAVDNPVTKEIMGGHEQFATAGLSFQSALLDCYPILRGLPDFMMPIKAHANQLFKQISGNYERLYKAVKRDVGTGTAKACLCANISESQEKVGLSDTDAGYLAGSMIEAGTAPTTAILYGFVQAMITFPGVLERAQAEVDRVIGSDRLPTMEDECNLPFIRACVKESLRWMPTAILGAVPHCLTQDDEYMGYKIPKGAVVINNVYSINMDPTQYPNPRRFEPDRYKDDLPSAPTAQDVSNRDDVSFGAGRRHCQGMHVAERSLFIGISRLVWAFDMQPVIDSNGQPILPQTDSYTPGFVVGPTPFKAHLTPRSKGRAEIIRSEWAQAQEDSLDPVTKQWKH